MIKNGPKIIFWVLFAALMVATTQNENMRSELRERVERVERKNRALEKLRLEEHTHRYHDGKIKR